MEKGKTFQNFIVFFTAALGVVGTIVAFEPMVAVITCSAITVSYVIYLLVMKLVGKGFDRKVFEKSFVSKIAPLKTGLQLQNVRVLEAILQPRPDLKNDGLEYNLLKFSATIDSQGTYVGTYQAKGQVVSNRPVSGLKLIMAAAAREIDNLKATDTATGESLRISDLTKAYAELFPFEIEFNTAVHEGESFDVSWTFSFFRSCGTKEDDFDLFALWHYPPAKISGNVELDLRLDFPVQSVFVYDISKTGQMELNVSAKPEKQGSESHFITSFTPNPKSLGFIFKYSV